MSNIDITPPFTERTWTVPEFCAFFNITRTSLTEWEKRGLVKLIRIGRRVLVPPSEVKRLLNEVRNQHPDTNAQH